MSSSPLRYKVFLHYWVVFNIKKFEFHPVGTLRHNPFLASNTYNMNKYLFSSLVNEYLTNHTIVITLMTDSWASFKPFVIIWLRTCTINQTCKHSPPIIDILSYLSFFLRYSSVVSLNESLSTIIVITCFKPHPCVPMCCKL